MPAVFDHPSKDVAQVRFALGIFMPLGEDGGFTFYAAPGSWTLRVLAPGGVRAERSVTADIGKITELEVAV